MQSQWRIINQIERRLPREAGDVFVEGVETKSKSGSHAQNAIQAEANTVLFINRGALTA